MLSQKKEKKNKGFECTFFFLLNFPSSFCDSYLLVVFLNNFKKKKSKLNQ